MPLFEFRCEACQAVQECLVSNEQEQRSLNCLNCGSPKLTKLMSSFAINHGTRPKTAEANIKGQNQCAICGEQLNGDSQVKYVPALRVKIDREAGTASVDRGVAEIRHVRQIKPTDPSKLN
jgi:putative FmdB family regulatory protein